MPRIIACVPICVMSLPHIYILLIYIYIYINLNTLYCADPYASFSIAK